MWHERGQPGPDQRMTARPLSALFQAASVRRAMARPRGRGCRLSFEVAFALAFALLYLGRPMGWTLVYLDLVVCVAA